MVLAAQRLCQATSGRKAAINSKYNPCRVLQIAAFSNRVRNYAGKEEDCLMENKHKYEVGGKGAMFVLTVLFLLYILNFADRAIMAIVLEPMKAALQLSDAQAGAMQSIFLLGVGLLMIPGSIFVERWSRRKTLGLMAIIWSLATLATGLGVKFWHIMTARFAVGIGEAGYNPGGTAWLSLAFSKEVRGRVLGLFQSGAQVGMALGLIVGGWLVTQTGDWRTPFYFFAVPGVILGILTFFLPDYATIRKKGETIISRKFFSEVVSLFKIKTYSYNVAAQTLYAFVAMTIMGWLPTLLMRSYGIDAFQAGTINGLTGLIVIIGAPLGGFLGDRWQRKKNGGRAYFMVVAMFLFSVAAALMIFSTGYSLTIYIVMALVTSFCSGLVLSGLFAIWTDVLSPAHRTTGIGMGTMISLILGAVPGPLFLGSVSDAMGGGAAGLRGAFLLMMPVALIATIMYYVMSRYYPADSASVNDDVLAEK
jgi:MFS family permease